MMTPQDDPQCKVHWHEYRCLRNRGHKGKTGHTFLINGERVKKSPEQIKQSHRDRGSCSHVKKASFRTYLLAKLFCVRVELENGEKLVPYPCSCKAFHLTSRYPERETTA